MMAYLTVLRQGGLMVEGWGYHYPTSPGPQGDAIEERRQKLGFGTYHVNVEVEWLQPFGMPAAIKTLLNKLKVGGFEALICSFRFPSQQPTFPWSACAYHDAVDGWSPQVYWALAHNPGEQLARCVSEYNALPGSKVIYIYPVGPLFGSKFGNPGVWWEPTLLEIMQFRQAAGAISSRVYWYSLDWVIGNNRQDMLAAATGIDNGITPPPTPNPIPTLVETSVNTNLRTSPWGTVVVLLPAGLRMGVTGSALDAQGKRWLQVGAPNRYIAEWVVDVIS